MNRAIPILAALALLSLAPCATAGVIINLQPNTDPVTGYPSGSGALDGYPLGSFIYASSFVFNGAPGTSMTTIGMYMVNIGENNYFVPGSNSVDTSQYPGTPFQFEVLADNGNAPDPTTILGATGLLSNEVENTTSFELITASLTTSLTLMPNTEYWIAASTVGQASQGAYAVGLLDMSGGSDWYSNDSTGQTFDSLPNPQELAIYAAGPDTGVPGSAVPEPATLTLLSIGIACMAGYGWRRRKRATG